MTLAPAEQRLQELGVTDPSEIDLEAVAYDAGAAIRTRMRRQEPVRIGCSTR